MLLCWDMTLFSSKNQKGPLELNDGSRARVLLRRGKTLERDLVVDVAWLSTAKSLSGVLCITADRNDFLLFLL